MIRTIDLKSALGMVRTLDLKSAHELLDDLNERVDRTDNRIQRETRHIKIVDRKSNACCYYVVIIVLFVAILIVALVPYNGRP
ncbi:syntaxin-8-like [Elysia marginata]|uniref:Syntaxin-8-like n=1 Tax=Elysia marginata TaxID=1093978 RepID=A0AAV4FW58_9GAST|nr:syntaxin-8-like [Elysia marginata]